MDMELIRKWNSVVKEEDVVFHLGDFCFKGGKEGGISNADFYKSQLNGTMILIKGNHDHNNGAKTIIEDMTIHHGGRFFHLVHKPEDALGEYSLVGHIHEKWKIKREGGNILYNVGVDVNDFIPIDIQKINKEIDEFKKNTR
jgi:calcineurin-like phosphoesterase family protein